MPENQYSTSWYLLFSVIGTLAFSFLGWYIAWPITEIFPNLNSESAIQIVILITTTFGGSGAFLFLHQRYKNESLSWELMNEALFCKHAGVKSAVTEADDIPIDIVFNENAAGNVSEYFLFMGILMIQVLIFMISLISGESRDILSVILFVGAWILILILPNFYWVAKPQSKFGKFKSFWTLFWSHTLDLIRCNSHPVGETLGESPTHQEIVQRGYDKWQVDKNAIEWAEKVLERIQHNHLQLNEDDSDIEDKLDAIKLVEYCTDTIEKHNEIIENLIPSNPTLMLTKEYFEGIVDVMGDFYSGTLMKHVTILEGLQIAAVFPEAYSDLECARDGRLDDNIIVIDYVVNRLKDIHELPGLAIPNSVKAYLAFVAMTLALTPFFTMLIVSFFG